jgi:DNA polymerase-1
VLLIDGDHLLVYRIGFAVEHDRMGEKAYEYNIRNFLDSLINRFGDFERKIYLTGKDNFRDKVATILPYKGNRTGTKKPKYYQHIRDYLMAYYDAIMVDDMEADDAMGIEQMRYYHAAEHEGDTAYADSCIVACDKDMDMIPGWHYNPIKKDHYFITDNIAMHNFYKQCLTGDTCDNIPGLVGFGTKTAEKWLKEHGDSMESVEKAYTEAITVRLNGALQLQLKQKAHIDGMNESDCMKALDEIKELLWIRRA